MLTELQQITLRDVLRTTGLRERQIEDVLLLLRFKPERVQLAFYYRAQGLSQDVISELTGIPQQTISDYLNRECSDIKKYIYTG